MKTMNDFAGSKEFTLSHDNDEICEWYRVGDTARFYFAYNSKEEERKAMADARLFANSKKVLEAAIEAYYELYRSLQFEAINAGGSKDDVRNFVANNEQLKKLEQAINDSL